MKNVFLLTLVLLLSSFTIISATDSLEVAPQQEFSEEEMMVMYNAYIDSVDQQLKYDKGLIVLGKEIADLNVPTGFKYLNGKDSEMILTELWGNPPSEREEDKSLGMLILEDKTANSDSTFVINITYSEEGFIDDSDAKEIKYDELLEGMQSDIAASNDLRVEAGYAPVELVRWASPPFYDEANKKLHWAKEIKFGDAEENTLNYNIRVLGRRGFLELNVISSIDELEDVKRQIDPILASVNFKDGNRYIDFDPSLDKIAAVGIGGLIAGKVLAKAGLLAKLGIFLAKFWKIALIAIVGLGATIKRFFTGKKKEEETGEV
ncbi:MAG: putative membrane-anchored protein [Polaribacter sp.]|jgi:uncharacterized membrane-anchored protein